MIPMMKGKCDKCGERRQLGHYKWRDGEYRFCGVCVTKVRKTSVYKPKRY